MIISNSYAMLNSHFIFHVFNVFFHALTSSSVEKRLRRVSGALLEYRHSPHRRSCIHIYTVSVLLISEFVAPFTIYNIPFLVSPLSVTETLLKMHSHGSSSSGGSLAGSPSLAPGEERLMVSWQDRQYAIKANDFVLVAFRLPFAFVPRPTSKKTNAFRFCQKNHCISTTAAGINHANTCTTTCFRSRRHRRRCTTPPRHH